MSAVVGMESLINEAWSWLMDGSVRSIAILGKGGMGKTTVMRQLHNRLVSSVYSGTVIWVTVSSNLTVQKIQDDISKRIGLFDRNWAEKSFNEKATIIYNKLSEMKFVLFLDDVWERVDLRILGVPFLQGLVIFSTRNWDLIRRMRADRILQLDGLTEDEAWELFRRKVGNHILSDKRISDLAPKLVFNCAGLPILLCTVGRAMSRRGTHQEWKRALDEIKRRMEGMDNLNSMLGFCFDSLSNDRAKSCLLYFSFFPEDFTILRNELLDFWICEQLLGACPTIPALDMGYNIIDTLIGAGLLEEHNNYVQLLDFIRDVASSVAMKSQMFENAQLLEATDPEKLDTVGWLSPMANFIRDQANVPLDLFNFLLNHNPFVMVKGEFSQFMDSITVLDLSNSGVEKVPREISEFVSLQYLNLSHTWIEYLPIELKMLVKLKCLNLEHDDQLRVIPKQLILSLSALQVLKIFRCGFSVEELNDNILCVRNMDIDPILCLEHLRVLSITITCESALHKIFSNPRLLSCTQSLSLEVFWGSKLLDISPIASMKNLLALEIHQAEDLREFNINLYSAELLKQRSFERLQEVNIGKCSSLQELTWVALAPNLTVLRVKRCEQMEEIISFRQMPESLKGGEDDEPFGKLQVLELESLPNLKSIYWKALSFRCLKRIEIMDCSLLKKLPLKSDSANEKEVVIEAEEDWWEDVVWEDDATRIAFLPCFQPFFD